MTIGRSKSVARTVNVRPGYYVPGLPQDLLSSIRGADDKIEFAVLTVEYWTQPGISPYLALGELLKTLPEYLDGNNIDAFVRILARRGTAASFFNLLRDDVDRREAFRKFLQSLGLFEETYVQYATFGTNPKLLLDGFLYGLAESFTAIIKDLPEMAKLVSSAVEEWKLLFVLSLVSPRAAKARLGSHIAMLMTVWDALKDKLNPAHMPVAVWEQFNNWKKQFGENLGSLRPREAGRTLGKIAGDLYQLLTGVVGMAKFLRVSGKVAIQYAPLLLTPVRDLARRGSASVVLLARLLALLGSKVLHELPRVGLSTLTAVIPPDILRRVLRGGAGIVHDLGPIKVCMVSPPAFAIAAPGGRLGGRFAFMVMDQERPIFLAAVSEGVRGPQLTEEVAAVAKAVDQPKVIGPPLSPLWDVAESELDDYLDLAFRELAKQGKSTRTVDIGTLAVQAAIWAQLNQRLDRQLAGFIRELALRTLKDAPPRNSRVFAAVLGTKIDTAASRKLEMLLAAVAPKVRKITNMTFNNSLPLLASMDARLSPMAAKVKALCAEPVVDFLLRRPDLRQVLGIAEADRAAVLEFIKRWGYKESTQIGSLKSDALLVDSELATIRNIDWSSSTKMEKFEESFKALADSLGSSVPKGLSAQDVGTVDWDAIAKKFEALYSRKGLPKETVKALEGLKRLQVHAQRETVLRQAILEEALEHVKWSWHVSSHEIFYEGIDDLLKLLGSLK